MARANRHYIQDYVWHITHRCHKREFLLRFLKDRKRWIHWLFEAKKRFGLRILNYAVTSNHIHLLVIDSGQDVIPKSIQLVAGRTAQEYNQRKKRKGAFWEDRYHATAIAKDQHLTRCLIYIDVNMVRAGVVRHPSEWKTSGYNEIQDPRNRYSLIDLNGLVELCGLINKDQLRSEYRQWVEDSINIDGFTRESCWTESIAVGNRQFVDETKVKLGFKAHGRKVVKSNDKLVLKEPHAPYNARLDTEKDLLRYENMYFWDENVMNSIG
ncbi:MAG: transposase [Deltaproteobacteria bacterium]|nr:transposase [Deltaproteobacteria bacterium]